VFVYLSVFSSGDTQNIEKVLWLSASDGSMAVLLSSVTFLPATVEVSYPKHLGTKGCWVTEHQHRKLYYRLLMRGGGQ